ncbi:glycoside hydrolase family 9 protein [Thaumasiovibrio sp. DFM-14]|uniref:glycoside hydrolase family 9 protein n=1 Tax=Thaumasiovibrio sp. DFM-14 TaxID=3384792 RepID=UPI0039A2A999
MVKHIFVLLCCLWPAHVVADVEIVVNQQGYLPSGEKCAYLISAEEKSVKLLSFHNDQVVQEVNVGAAKTLPDGRIVRPLIFGTVVAGGWYYLQSGDVESVPFQINESVYDGLNNRLVRALYLQRSGTVVSDDATGMQRPESHMQDGIVYRTDMLHAKGDFIDVAGGWYDAGDFGKYVATTTVTVARLLEAHLQSSQGAVANDGVAEKSIFLNEAEYALDWLLKMQREDGAVYRKVSGAQWPAKIPPWQDRQQRYIYGVSTPETAKFAATMAFAARVYKPYDINQYRIYLKAALHAWNYLETQSVQYIDWQSGDDSGSGPYIKNKEDMEVSLETDTDDRLWALSELYITTGNQRYLKLYESLYTPSLIAIFEWKNPMLMGLWHLIQAEDTELTRRLTEDLNVVAERYVQQAASSPFSVANQRFIWGSNKMTAEAGILVAWSDIANGKRQYQRVVQSQLDYLLGANAFNMSFVTNSGVYSVNNLHHLYRIASGVSLPGFLVGGPNEKAQAGVAPKDLGMLSYVDSEKSYAVNEFAIDYNASLIGLLAVNHAYFN